ncbi:hypothetical protein HPB50_021619 [Hyalomma asiaticum]|uniref:Uncharacterized protein n=1 Tax=Hyalomma asiaticum TaxID=266040 RepID=A0ACB7SX36_HYAAI|nr:hypothetical protein HPB50_021619 [Hyalomma asiaticum]
MSDLLPTERSKKGASREQMRSGGVEYGETVRFPSADRAGTMTRRRNGHTPSLGDTLSGGEGHFGRLAVRRVDRTRRESSGTRPALATNVRVSRANCFFCM